MSSPITPAGFEAFERSAIESSIAQRFRQRVSREPGRLALKFGPVCLSYGQLDAQANRFAQAILVTRGSHPEPVAVVIEQGPALIAAILGVLKAGKFYVPLEAGHPRERLEYMLVDSGAKLALASASALPLLQGLARSDVNIVVAEHLPDRATAADPGIEVAASAHAYIYYTTGSTGQPKGVVDSHRNVLHNVMRYTNGLHITRDDRLTLLQSASFSGAVSSMFAALLNGAALFPFDVRNSTAQQLADYVDHERITIYHSVPSIFRSFLRGERRFPSVRVIRLEGDQAAALDIELFRRHFGAHSVLANGLGATETGIVRRFLVGQDDRLADGIVPIGYPVEDMDVFVVNDSGEPAAIGATGEIAVRSAFLACGYWNRPQATERAFLPDPTDAAQRIYRTGDLGRLRPDGCLEHLGRKDSRRKIRGITVVLSEIEAAMQIVPTIREAVVADCDDRGTERRLVAYYVAKAGCDPTASELRRQLAGLLPPPMMPSAFVRLEHLPLNENLKVDRSQLPPPTRERPRLDVSYLAPRDPTEAQLVRIWEELLQVAPVGVCDDFFDLGGDSLLAMQMITSVEQETGRDLPPSTLLAGSTIEHIAERLRSTTMVSPAIVPIRTGGDQPRFYFLHGDYAGGGLYCRAIAREMAADQPFLAVTPCGLDGERAPGTIEEMAERHLRALREAQPQGPYWLGGNCNGGLIALEMARQLVAAGESVERLIVIRTSVRNVRHVVLRHLVERWGGFLGLSTERQRAAVRHLRWFAEAWASGSSKERLMITLAKPGAVLRWVWHRLARKPASPTEADRYQRGETHPADRDALIATFTRAAADHVPDSYAGAVAVLWPEIEPEPADEAIKWWRQVSPHAEIEIIPGDHLTAVTAHAKSLAGVLSARLARQVPLASPALRP